MSERTPLMPRPVNAPQPDSHHIYLRACHSSWRLINPRVLTLIRLILSGYLISVAGVSLKYKLEANDSHPRWRILFQFSTVTFILLLAYNLQVAVWTIMHLLFPQPTLSDSSACQGQRLRNRFIVAMSPPSRATCPKRKFFFSLFYTVAHMFTFTNTIIYWAVLVPSGHGGFKAPNIGHHHGPSRNQTSALYDQEKGLFEEGNIKAFSIINVWSITSVIAFMEVMFLNSIRRQTPVAGHLAGVVVASCAYLAWAGLGKLTTGHWELFFLDPSAMGNVPKATAAASLAFLCFTLGVFSYVYGLIAMRESMTAHHGAH